MKIALYQLSSQMDYQFNFEKIKSAAKEASECGAKALFLPECFYSFSDGKNITPFVVTKNNEHFQSISSLAQDCELYLLGGSVVFEEQGKVYNRSLNFSPLGKLITHYDKINMFSIKDPQITIDESKLYQKGTELKTFEFDQFKVGLNICFDLRFSDLARSYVKKGCNLLSYSSAFTYRTGIDHWEILLKARAIETQSFVVACNQWGTHNGAVKTYGHSMVINPWGKVLANAYEGEKLIYADLNYDEIQKVKNKISMN